MNIASVTQAEGNSSLRNQAEKKVKGVIEVQKPRSAHENMRLVHELEVHQVELEMQNDELRHFQDELELSRNKYAKLYDFAPVGYFTFDASGIIIEANLTGAGMLESERNALIKSPFTKYIADAECRRHFLDHLALVLLRKVLLRCEIRLVKHDGTYIQCSLQSVANSSADGTEVVLTSVADITVRRQLGEKLQLAHDMLEVTVHERTAELTRSNVQLIQEIEEHRKAEESLLTAYAEIKQLKDRLQAENVYLQQEVARQYNFGEVIGQGKAISLVFAQAEQVAPMNATVLLFGETGTGKGVVARAIHSCSSRKNRPMITVNCAALPGNLIESELFGRERGAFTGSDARQIGRFELADGGTIFLDEIGEMPLELQPKLLRVIQDGEFERLGSPRTIKIDVRIIAASNRNLKEEIVKGTFREDLYYRLNVFPITIPPLRQRREDIPQLVQHFVAKYNKKIGKKIESVPADTLKILQEYHWPGNVRELESIVERAVIISRGTMLQVLDNFDVSLVREDANGQEVRALADLEHDHVLQVLQKTGWRIEGKNGAALLLGLNASTLRARMRKYGIARQ